MPKEIERKFFFKEIPQELVTENAFKELGTKKIIQNYLAYSEAEEIRIRKITSMNIDDHSDHVITHKRGSGVVREETEIKISEEIYNQINRYLCSISLEKIRRKLEYKDLILEIDQYNYYDFKTVEIEFRTEEEAENFNKPYWFGNEITSEPKYKNINLWLELQKK